MNLRNLTYKLDKIRNEIGLIYNGFLFILFCLGLFYLYFYFDEIHSLIIELKWGGGRD